ncbi:bifunctional riboflavin kinase/FAD synthetase [Sphingomonas sp.]|uniref:bifunctional riboflavin kinase/FAD synthetase n=1 Tax=Sphingomonas sp. TaxID=28214 RepID=UPI0025EFF2F0|nr:bifunctional riboflavin kinase/FAD synthetase [Sphingomonas sp.]MBV9527037.1 bifunctional riboflavin kinase/FAD synthetase [Sphingomonas sp.]
MQRLTLAGGVPDTLRGSVVALGNFDGFHLGHQAVVGRAVQRGFHERRPVIVATFDPHPVRLFKPDVPPFRLSTLDQRQELFAHAGADAMLVFEFDSALAAMDAEQFVAEVLADRIGAAAVITGDDFSFGKGRTGDVALLKRVGEAHGLAAEAVSQVLVDGVRVSSGRVRDALIAGDTATATHMLSRPYTIEGVVQPGDKRGRDLGYPTANVALTDYQRPRYGIYAVRVTLDDGRELPGVASLGVRPTFNPPTELLEAHIFDFDADLYGRRIEVALHAFLRDEAKFDDMKALTAQMREDEAEARRLLL